MKQTDFRRNPNITLVAIYLDSINLGKFMLFYKISPKFALPVL
jgi:hypothetical protein